MRRVVPALLLLGLHACHSAPPTEPEPPDLAPLEAALAGRIREFRGDVGIYVRHVPSGRELAMRADEVFPTASLVKVPILLALFQRMHDGELDHASTLEYDEARRYPGEDLLASFRDGETIATSKLIHLMVAFSDNTASLWCQELAGGGEGINAWLAERGFEHTRVNSRTPGREEARRAHGWGQTSPREMAELLVRIREARAVEPSADEEMYRVLCKTYWDAEACSPIPPWVQVASKQGAVNASRSEVLLVNAPSGDYVLCVITKNQEDRSWENDNAGFVLLRDVSRLCWEHFEGPWSAAEGADDWW